MRVAVIIPPVEDFYFTPHRNSALGARILVNLLEKQGHDLGFYNFPGMKGKRGIKRQIPLPKELYYLKPYLLPKTGHFFTNYNRFGPDDDECIEILRNFSPQIICISLFAYAYEQECTTLCEKIKTEFPDTRLIIGGAGVSVLPEKFLSRGIYDVVAPGEAEALADNLLDSDKTSLTEKSRDWESVPLPVWGMTRMPRNTGTVYSSAVSRGCPFACSFCSNHLTQGRKFRHGNSDTIISALQATVHPFTQRLFLNFEDDNMLSETNWALELLKRIKSLYPRASLLMENGIDYRFLDGELIEKLINLGLSSFNISLADPARSKDRIYEKSRYKEVLQRIHKKGGKTTSYIIPGMPENTPFETGRLLGELSVLKTNIGVSMFYPVPGLPGFTNTTDLMKIPSLLLKGSSAYPWNKSLSTNELVSSFILARSIIMGDTENLPEIQKIYHLSEDMLEGFNSTKI